MSDTIDVQQVYIKTLEENVINLTKNKMIQDTNVTVLNSVCDQKDSQIRELNQRNFDLNEAFGRLQTQHQEEIEVLRKEHENNLSVFHADYMKEVEKTHREKNDALSEVWNRFNNLQIEYDLVTSRYETAQKNLERKTKEYEIISTKYNILFKNFEEYKSTTPSKENSVVKTTKKPSSKKDKSEKNLSSF